MISDRVVIWFFTRYHDSNTIYICYPKHWILRELSKWFPFDLLFLIPVVIIGILLCWISERERLTDYTDENYFIEQS